VPVLTSRANDIYVSGPARTEDSVQNQKTVERWSKSKQKISLTLDQHIKYVQQIWGVGISRRGNNLGKDRVKAGNFGCNVNAPPFADSLTLSFLPSLFLLVSPSLHFLVSSTHHLR
jgi:hypothetical protein